MQSPSCAAYPLLSSPVIQSCLLHSARLTVHLCHAIAPRAPTPATASRATPRRPPRAPPKLGPPPRTVGRRLEPTTGHSVPSCSSPMAASPVSAFFIHSPARPTRPPAPPESQEPRRPLQRQPRPLHRPTADDSPPPERRCHGEPLTVSFPSLHRPKSDPEPPTFPSSYSPTPSHLWLTGIGRRHRLHPFVSSVVGQNTQGGWATWPSPAVG
jgi:hypothetical protein